MYEYKDIISTKTKEYENLNKQYKLYNHILFSKKCDKLKSCQQGLINLDYLFQYTKRKCNCIACQVINLKFKQIYKVIKFLKKKIRQKQNPCRLNNLWYKYDDIIINQIAETILFKNI